MRQRILLYTVLFAASSTLSVSSKDLTTALTQVATVSLPNVMGRIDHLAIDANGNRLFVCALGNNSVEVIDLKSNSVVYSIRGLSEPQGVYYLPEDNKIYVTNAGNGECDVYEGSSYKLMKRIDLGGDADNLHFDPSSRRMYISAGNVLSIMDVADDSVVGSVALPGHPEGFALGVQDPRIFVNVPLPSRAVFVIDRGTDKVVNRWPIGGLLSDAFSNFPMALDEKDGRLFVGTRVPASMKVLDVSTGKIVASLKTDGDADDIYYDSERHRVYVSCGAGFIDAFQQSDPDHYQEAARLATASGGRTSLWVPELSRLFLAVPHAGDQPAQICVYSADGSKRGSP